MSKHPVAFDLESLESEDTHTANIVNPKTGDDIEGVTITVYGQDSDEFKAATTRMRARMAEFFRRNPGMKAEARQKEVEKFERTRVISCIKGIDGFIYKGQPITDPAEACTKFGWVYDQAAALIDNRANFIKG